MAKEGNVTLPNWSKEPKYTKPLPSSNDIDKIPSREQIKDFKGLPSSTMPKPFKMEGGNA
jgi:hypothetical protein